MLSVQSNNDRHLSTKIPAAAATTAATTSNDVQIVPGVRSRLRWDLGIRGLLPEWKVAMRLDTLFSDVVAGVTVPCVSFPVLLAAGVLMGVPPHLAMIAAVVGSIGVWFGGSRYAIVGPATSMAFVMAPVIAEQGLEALFAATVGAGILQLTCGVTGLASAIKCVPTSILFAFPTGLGASIFMRQICSAFGLSVPKTSDAILNVAAHPSYTALNDLWSLVSTANLSSAAMAVTTLLACVYIPKKWPHFPAPLACVVAFTALQMGGGVSGVMALLNEPSLLTFIPDYLHANFKNIASLGPLPDKLTFHGASLPANLDTAFVINMVQNTLLVFSLGAMQSLMSANSIDKMVAAGKVRPPPKGVPPARHDPNQEMIGQGIANTTAGMIGCLPVTTMLAQSSLNMMSGAQSRRAALVSASTITAAMIAFAPYFAHIPIPALTGVLCAVTWKMISLNDGVKLWKNDGAEGALFFCTAAAMAYAGVVPGMAVGSGLALSVAAYRRIVTSIPLTFHYTIARTVPTTSSVSLESSNSPNPMVSSSSSSIDATKPIVVTLTLDGGLSFFGGRKLDELRTTLLQLDGGCNSKLCIDGTGIKYIDLTAAEQLSSIIQACRSRFGIIDTSSLSKDVAARLQLFHPLL